MRHLLILALTLWIASAVAQAQSTSWTDYGVGGKRFELVSETGLVVYYFRKSGSVTATIGQKKGPVAGPIFYWRIDGERLLISTHDGTIFSELTLLTATPTEISAKSKSGEILTFKVSESP